MSSSELPGVGVLVVRDEKVLLGRRTSPHGHGTWAPPGGKAEPGESNEETARRELLEETGLVGAVPKVVAETVDTFPGGECWRTLWVQMEWVSGEPEELEPDEVVQLGLVLVGPSARAALPPDGVARRKRVRPVRLARSEVHRITTVAGFTPRYARARENDGRALKHFDHDNQAPRAELVRLSQPAERTRERTRFAQVLEDAADLLERHGELPGRRALVAQGSTRLATVRGGGAAAPRARAAAGGG